MMILSICNSPSVLEIINIILLLVDIIKIAIPIVLIIVLMLKIMKAVSGHDSNELQKVLKSSVSNMIAAVLIFLIPTIITLVANLSMSSVSYSKCLVRKTDDEIALLYYDNAEKLIRTAEESLSMADYANAISYLVNIKDKDKKSEYEERLAKVKEEIDSKESEGHQGGGEGQTQYQGNQLIVNEAKKYIKQNVGTDCSGFVKHKVLKPLGYLQDDIARASGYCDGKSRGSYGMHLKYTEKGRVVWKRPGDATTLESTMKYFPGDCKPGDIIFYSYGNNECVKHVVVYAGYENGKPMIVDSNQQDNIVRYRAVDGIYWNAIPLSCVRPIKNEE